MKIGWRSFTSFFAILNIEDTMLTNFAFKLPSLFLRMLSKISACRIIFTLQPAISLMVFIDGDSSIQLYEFSISFTVLLDRISYKTLNVYLANLSCFLISTIYLAPSNEIHSLDCNCELLISCPLKIYLPNSTRCLRLSQQFWLLIKY